MPGSSLLIVGCGDVGLRVLRHLPRAVQVLALTSDPGRREALRAAGAVPLTGDLDDGRSLRRLAALADRVLHLAPPAAAGARDDRSMRLAHALARAGRVRRLVYASTTGVYGDAGGEWVDETRWPAPATDRARRRAHAEALWRWFGRHTGAAVTILRVPGIYALDRPGGDPRERLARGTPVLDAQDDVFTNHIHADDLARACIAALWRGAPQRVVNASDDSDLRMGDYFALAASLHGLPPPPRRPRAVLERELGPASLSFMSESRRLRNRRLLRELRLRLRYPTVREGLDPQAALWSR